MVSSLKLVSISKTPPALIPNNDLSRHVSKRSLLWGAAVEKVLQSGIYLQGQSVSDFENSFSSFCGTYQGVGVANGTDALELSLRASGCGHGTEVIVTGNSGSYGTIASLAVGATPVIVDVTSNGLMDCDLVSEAVTNKTRAIIATHLYGQSADITAIRHMLSENIVVIEDVAQAHGARQSEGMAGSLGDLSCFSFYPTKNLGGFGDGGFVTGKSQELIGVVKELAQYGWSSKYKINRPYGRNSRLDEIQAAVLQIELDNLAVRNKRRTSIAAALVKEIPHEFRVTPASSDDPSYVGHLCVVRHPERKRVVERLLANGIATSIHYPIPDHLQAGLKGLVRAATHLGMTEVLCGEVFSLPNFPELLDSEIEFMVGVLRKVF